MTCACTTNWRCSWHGRPASEQVGWLLPVFMHDPVQHSSTHWGFARMGAHRRAFLGQALHDLGRQLAGLGSGLLQLHGSPAMVLPELARRLGARRLVCEAIAAPEELAEVQALRAAGLQVETVWQSSLIDPADLPFAPEAVPDTFTTFRQKLERAGVLEAGQAPAARRPCPCGRISGYSGNPCRLRRPGVGAVEWLPDDCRHAPTHQALAARSALPLPVRRRPAASGGEPAALAHLAQYCARGLPHSYKDTRNGLAGLDYSSKLVALARDRSPVATPGHGRDPCLRGRARRQRRQLLALVQLLWRDHFRWMSRKHGRRLYWRPRPVRPAAARAQRARLRALDRGPHRHALVDAGMRELSATGYLSNRLRQNVASYLVHDLGCDWRAGAAWFEAQLIHYDCVQQPGQLALHRRRGTDPRGGRRFNTHKQAQDHDPDGAYRRLWGRP